MYRGSFTVEKTRLSHYLSVASNPFYGGRLSSSSLPGRRGSSVSVLSERRSSLTAYLAGRRFSDVSIASDPKLSCSHNTDATTASPFVPKREVMFSPIHEEVSDFEAEATDQQVNTSQKQLPQITVISDQVSVKGSDMFCSELYLELLEEPTLPKLITTYKSTAV